MITNNIFLWFKYLIPCKWQQRVMDPCCFWKVKRGIFGVPGWWRCCTPPYLAGGAALGCTAPAAGTRDPSRLDSWGSLAHPSSRGDIVSACSHREPCGCCFFLCWCWDLLWQALLSLAPLALPGTSRFWPSAPQALRDELPFSSEENPALAIPCTPYTCSISSLYYCQWLWQLLLLVIPSWDKSIRTSRGTPHISVKSA